MAEPILADVIRVEKNTRAEFTGEALKKGQDGWCLNTDVPARGIELFHRKLGSGDYVNLGVQTQSLIDTASTADRARANHTGTQLASTISDFDTAVASTGVFDADAVFDGNGVISGCDLSIGTPNTTFTISAGTYHKIGTSLPVAYAGQANISVTSFVAIATYVAVRISDEAVIQQATPFTPEQRRTHRILGAVIHSNHSFVNAVNNHHEWAVNSLSQLNDSLDSLGPWNDSGNVFSPNGANLSINKSAGKLFKKGSNNSADNPHIKTLGAITAATFRFRLRDGTEDADTTTIDMFWDNNGVKTALGHNEFAIHRIAIFETNLVRIQRGQAIYSSMADAISGVHTEPFIYESNIADNGLVRGFLIVRGNATSLQDASRAEFLETDKFGQVAINASGSVTTLQGAYDNSTEPEILTNSVNGAVTIQRGSASDDDKVFEIKNGAGAGVKHIKGSGDTNIHPTTKGVMGFDDDTAPTQQQWSMSFDIPSSTFTLTPLSIPRHYYYLCEKVTVSTPKTIQCLFATNRRWYIMMDGTTGNLMAVNTLADGAYTLIRDNVFVAELYWNVAGTDLIVDAFEAHGASMGWATHLYAHNNERTRYTSGLAVLPVDNTTNVTIGLGEIADEDIPWSITQRTAGASLPVLYRSGTTWDGASFLAGVATSGGNAVYNLNTGGYYSLVAITSSQFCCVHYYARLSFRGLDIFTILGQAVYNTAPEARSGAQTELTNLATGGLPMAEFKALGTAIIDGGTGNWTFEPVDGAGGMIVDWRSSNVGSAVSSAYSLPVASATVLGGVLSGSDISVSATGVVTVPTKQNSLPGLVPAADKLHYWTGAATGAMADLTTYIRTLLAAVDAPTARAILEARYNGTGILAATAVTADAWYTILETVGVASTAYVDFEIVANYSGVGGAAGRVGIRVVGDVGAFRSAGIVMLTKGSTNPIKSIRSCYVSGGTSRVQVQMRGTYSTVTTTIKYSTIAITSNSAMNVVQYRDDSAVSLTVLDTIDVATGGLMQPCKAVTASTTGTIAADTGLVKVTGTGDITLTLSLANSNGSGTCKELTIKNLKTSGTLTVQRQGSDNLYLYGGTTPQTNTTVSVGTALHMESDGAADWYVIS